MCGPYPEWDMQALEEDYQVHRLWEGGSPESVIAAAAGDIRAIATRGELGASASLMNQLPELEIVCCYGVGTDAIDLGAARSRGVRVTNTPEVLTGDVADMAVGLALATMRRIPAADAHVRSGAWRQGNMPLVSRLYGKKVGIAGYGRIGQTIARRLSGFEVDLGYFDVIASPTSPHKFFPSLVELARWCDLLVIALAGGGATQGAVAADVLQALGPQGWLVNVSRGSTVNEGDLLDVLERHEIAGAGLDVFWNEPAIDPRFAALPNVVLQPHHASGTLETRRAMGELVRANLRAHFAGQPLPTPVI